LGLEVKEKSPLNGKKLWIYLAVLLLVFVLWGGAKLFFPKKSEEAKNPPLFPNLITGKIAEIQWQRGTEVVHLKKKSSWVIIWPISVLADSKVVEGFLQTLTTLRPERRFADSKKDLKEFGLEVPKGKILFLVEGKWTEIQLGNKNPVGNASYVKVSNLPDFFLIEDPIIKELDRDLLALRDKRVFSFDLNQVQAMEIKKDKRAYSLERDPKGWMAKDLPGKKLNQDKVETFLSDLLWLQAKGFAESGPEDLKRGFKTPQILVRLSSQGKGAKEEALILGKEEPGKGLWAKSSLHKDVIVLDPSIFKKIPDGPEEWEEKSPPQPAQKGP
jgi:hypothetical protein